MAPILLRAFFMAIMVRKIMLAKMKNRKNKHFSHFLHTTGPAPNGADFTPSVFYSYHGEKNYAFKDEKQKI